MVLPLDSAIGIILIKVFDCYQKYSQEKLIQAYRLVKASFLCHLEPDFDSEFLIAQITLNARVKNTEFLTQYAEQSTK